MRAALANGPLLTLVLATQASCNPRECEIQGDPTTPWVSAAAGGRASCGIHEDGALECWGGSYRDDATCAVVDTFAAVAMGNQHTCAIAESGAIRCWGLDTNGVVSAPPSGSDWEIITSGTVHSCASGPSGTACWGDNDFGQATPPDVSVQYVSLDAAQKHTCGVRVDGSVDCWGSPENGVLNIPDLLEGETWGEVGAAWFFNCGTVLNPSEPERQVLCWGAELEADDFFDQPPLEEAKEAYAVGRLRANGTAACVIATVDNFNKTGTEDQLRCWGTNTSGILGAPTDDLVDYELGASSDDGTMHGCAIRSSPNEMFCWGDTSFGQQIVPTH